MTRTLARALALFAMGLSSACGEDFTGPTKADAALIADGVAVTGLSGEFQSQKYYRIVVPASAFQLSITTSGGSGDVDLIVKYGDIPRTDNGDCGSVTNTNADNCTFQNPRAGNWYIMLFGSGAYSGVTLVATITMLE